jgi:FAD/FMN-containing dehydrogenase
MTTEMTWSAPGRLALAQAFRGELIGQDHPSYHERRKVWNGSIDRHPRLIARCTGVRDVVAALHYARQEALAIAVRGGGHSFPGHSVCDNGIVIDLGPMKGIRVDPQRRTVRAEGGVLLGELDRATQAHGLAMPVGSVTHTGLAGLTLGGGFGWLMRRYGLAIDQLLSVEIVTADGEVLHASDDENPDLFWAVRGGGGNFGIVTYFTYRLHRVGPTVLSGLLLWPLDQGPEVARFYRDWAASVPDEMTTALIMRRAPAVDLIPESLHGRPVIAVACCWIGGISAGESVLRPMRRFGSDSVDLVAPRPYVEHQGIFDPSFPHGMWVYSQAADVRALSDDALDVMLEHAVRIGSPRSTIVAWQLGGAVGRVGELDTAFGSRTSAYLVDILGSSDAADRFEREREWARECWAALRPHHAGVYVNWLMDEGTERVLEAYGEQRYRRLQAAKRRYDPENVFRLNQNIAPA